MSRNTVSLIILVGIGLFACTYFLATHEFPADRDNPLIEELREVATVDVAIDHGAPTVTVWQLDDWNLIPREEFNTEKEWQQHLDDVEEVQRQQTEVLRILAAKGKNIVLLGGMTERDVKRWKIRGNDLREQEKEQDAVRKDLAEAKRLMLPGGVKKAEALLAKYRQQVLLQGAPFQAITAGADLDIRPLEQAATLSRDSLSDKATLDRRHQAMLEAIEDCDSKAVVILLSTAHDLTDALRTRKTVRYLRITVPRVAALMGE